MKKTKSPQSLELPDVVITKAGVEFDPREMLWNFRDGDVNINIDFMPLAEILTNEALWAFKKTLINIAEGGSPGSYAGTAKHMKQLFDLISDNKEEKISLLTLIDLSNVRGASRAMDGHDRTFNQCKMFLQRAVKLGYPIMAETAAEWIKKVKLKHPPVGVPVTTSDPVQGHFTNLELEALVDAFYEAFADGRMSLNDYVIGWMVAIWGARPTQYAAMKLCDLRVVKTENGEDRYKLKIPLAKGKGFSQRGRFSDEADLIPELARVFLRYKAEVAEEFSKKMDDVEQAPFFPIRLFNRHGKPTEFPPGMEFHQTSTSLSQRVSRIFNSLNVYSERTGERININPYRFRYTVGTNCGREGYSPHTIARRLGQASTSRTQIYVAFSKEMRDRIEQKTAAAMGLLARSFRGELVTEESGKNRAPEALILNPAIDPSMNSPMGDCGKHAFCSLNRPISCYPCPLFRPWVDGPHQAVYDYLMEEQQRLKAAGCDDRILSVNDRIITIVAAVNQMCKEAMQKHSTSNMKAVHYG